MKRNEAPSLEAALDRLEAIADELERGDLSLDEALKRFEEGVEQVRVAERVLEEAEGRLVQLVESEEGVREAPLESDG